MRAKRNETNSALAQVNSQVIVIDDSASCRCRANNSSISTIHKIEANMQMQCIVTHTPRYSWHYYINKIDDGVKSNQIKSIAYYIY